MIQDDGIHICNFCGKTNKEAFLMITTEDTDTDICNKCVVQCVEIMLDESSNKQNDKLNILS